MSHAGKIVVVTGSGKGIGRCIAGTYAAEGAKVILAEKDILSGRETERLIASDGGQAIFKETDVSKPENILKLFAFINSKYKGADILINNTGISIWKSPLDLSVNEWDTVINTNLRSTFLCSREVAKLMKKKGGGSIVNISSTRAFMSEPDSEAYAATKGQCRQCVGHFLRAQRACGRDHLHAGAGREQGHRDAAARGLSPLRLPSHPPRSADVDR